MSPILANYMSPAKVITKVNKTKVPFGVIGTYQCVLPTVFYLVTTPKLWAIITTMEYYYSYFTEEETEVQ